MMPKQPRIASLALRDQLANRRRPTTAKAITGKPKEARGALADRDWADEQPLSRSLPPNRSRRTRPASDSERQDSDDYADGEVHLSPAALVRQNGELRQRLADEAASYKSRLDTYRQAQQHQAALVSRLQAKVLQYKQRCSQLESHATEGLGPGAVEDARLLGALPPSQAILQAAQQAVREIREEQIQDLETALLRLQEERARGDRLAQLDAALREQLEESHRTNEALTNDLQKLSSEWDALREELTIKEDEWREEELAFSEYCSSEHGRLLGLWREVVSVKRLYADMKFATERDLDRMRGQMGATVGDAVSACGSTGFLLKLQAAAASSGSALGQLVGGAPTTEQADGKAQLQAARDRLDQALQEMRGKDERIQQLLREVQTLEERCCEAEQNLSQKLRLQENFDVLESALRDIAHAVIQDAETRDLEERHAQSTPHLHLSPSAVQLAQPGGTAKRALSSGRAGLPLPAFAESTTNAVQAALHKYQLTIHELEVKLQGSGEQLGLARKQVEALDQRLAIVEEKREELTAQLDLQRAQTSQLAQEKETLERLLEGLRAERQGLDKQRLESVATIDRLSGELTTLDRQNALLEKQRRSLEDEKADLEGEVSRLGRECELREGSLRQEEERMSKLREDVLALTEDLNRAQLAGELAEQQRLEEAERLAQAEKARSEVELELERTRLDGSDLQEVLAKMQELCLNHEREICRLEEELRRAIEENRQLSSQCTDQQADLGSIKKELLQAEQTRLDLESEKASLRQKNKFLETEKEKLEAELAQLGRERSDLSSQLSAMLRKKDGLQEELTRTRQKLEQANEMNARLNRDLDDVFKENEEKQLELETYQKEMQRLQEILASARSEKEALEAVLFDAQSNLEAASAKKSQLEKEKQELLVKQESLKGNIQRLTKDLENSEKHTRDVKQKLTQLSQSQEAEFQTILVNMKKNNEEALRKLNEEKEQIKASLEKKMQQNLAQVRNDKENEISQLNERMEELQVQMENLCQQHEESLMRAQNDKQQALLLAQQDQQSLMERLENLHRELEGERNALERLRRETASNAEQDRSAYNKARDELTRIKSKLEETKLRAEEERLKLELKIEEIRNERDTAQKEVEELHVQLQMAEDKYDELQNQLQETSRKLREGEITIENSRKELVDVRRQLQDSNLEKEKYNGSNKDLRNRIKQIEGEKREQTRATEEAYQKISSLEDTKANLEADRNRLQGDLRDTERDLMQLQQQLKQTQDELEKANSANSQAQSSEKDLQARLASEMDERERLQLQMHQMKKQMAELDGSLEVTQQELAKLRSRAEEQEQAARGREQELRARIDEGVGRERKLEGEKHNLEVCLTDASQQIKELQTRLGAADGRVRALEAQLSKCESDRRELEQKLSSVVHTLRRFAGVQLDGSVSWPLRASSPTRRRFSPARAAQDHQDAGRGGELIVDVDPEAVRRGVMALLQKVMQIERERDDCRAELTCTRKQVLEAQDSQNRLDIKVNALVNSLRNLQDEKNAIEARLSQKQAQLQGQVDMLQEKSDECERLRDKVVSLEMTISSEMGEKAHCEDKVEKLKQTIHKLESEKRMLREDLKSKENQVTQLEVNRMSLEGDLQRLQMVIQEKDANMQRVLEQCDSHGRAITSLEDRCASLRGTIDDMKHSLERAAVAESDLKAELNVAHRSLIEANAHAQSDAERTKQLQKQLSAVEGERRVLVERLESLQQGLSELRHANHTLTEQSTRLQNDLANSEVLRSGLEAQLRMASWPRDQPANGCTSNKEEDLYRQLQLIQRERADLKGKIELLNDKVKSLENEKRSLERQVSCARSCGSRSKSYERQEKAHAELLGTSTGAEHLEQENRELRMKLRRLEAQLAEREAEVVRLKAQLCHSHSHAMLDAGIRDLERNSELGRSRAAQLQAEKLLEAREQSHRQQVLRLEAQVRALRDQLSQEHQRRRQYVQRSSETGREMQHIRQALGDSLRLVAQNPDVGAGLLEAEARKLDCTVSASRPGSLALPGPPGPPPIYLPGDRRSPAPSSLL